ncbi:MAG: UDP-N-acetylglucosamine--N-acetylmuramyl-(pentapeptide) pyrophosphoryl-undecaprenol N-acetylglucosamine transferase [Dehalococcoidia bacterium]
MRLALTAGGTGGHIFPAMAVLDALRLRPGLDLDVRFFGPENRGERAMVESHGVAFEAVPSAGVRGRSPLRLIQGLCALAWGTVVAFRKLRRFRPDAVFSTGGYASFPASLAARVLRRPLVVYLPDVTPGWAVRAETRLATRIATTTDAALAHLPAAKTAVTGYPVRSAFFTTTREEARARLQVGAEDRVLLVAGASQGAQAINEAVFAALPELAALATVVHVTGPGWLERAEQRRSQLPIEVQARYRPAAFRDDLPDVMVGADLAVMRAGASTLGEIPAAALPVILVPGTFAGGHQRDNARWLEGLGAAEVVAEKGLGGLAARVTELLVSGSRLEAMREAARSAARPDAADRIADLVLEVAR